MRNDFPKDRFNDANADKAFDALAAHQDFDLVRWAILRRYAEVRQLFLSTDPNVAQRAVGKMEELEWVLDRFGTPLYGGLPLADGTSSEETANAALDLALEIGGGDPGGIRLADPRYDPGVASGL